MLGSTVLWFARDEAGDFVSPARWPRNALATISTHDLPTAPGFLTGEHVRVRDELKLLGTDVAVERARAAADRDRLLTMLRAENLLPEPAAGSESAEPAETPDDGEVVVAMHAALAASPTRLLGVSLYDVLGEVRQPNMPGTVDEYPNWRLPLPAGVAQIRADPRVTRVVDLLSAARPRPADRRPAAEE
ncbi:4-alpha-glucanotransferase [Micromonospora ureilytica]|uniref:4-alpha-glucanotransferase n=1 Tax=Micromonospora ureilytica TaxID=709868 RepID=UPI0040393310